MAIPQFFSLILLIFLLSCAAVSSDCNNQCSYTIRVKTGSVAGAGTNTKISLSFSDGIGKSADIPNLEEWGIMPRGIEPYDYFERGNTDFFMGLAPCTGPNLCQMSVATDGSNPSSAEWFCDAIEVFAAGIDTGLRNMYFPIGMWVHPSDNFTISSCEMFERP